MNDLQNPAGERLDHHFHPGGRRGSLVILGHGLTGNMDRPLLVAAAEGLSARGWPCLRISFSGNGASQGRFEDSNITKHIQDLKAVLATVPDYVRVAYIGHSMGAAVGVLTAAQDLRIRALVSLAGMTHTADFAEREFRGLVPGKDSIWEDEAFPLSAALVDDLKAIGSTLDAAARVAQPWLLIHGTADDLVPPDDGRDAYAAAHSEKQWLEIPGAGHVFDEESYPQIIEAVDAWLTPRFGTQ
ncbi:MAG: alpha/beta hydrolase [Luteolibacter sp.]|jgi:pimeloyl-ACP methyl ester carboxylesterase|nr:alpha/beta hydrolase [Luteolibacter sp.]